VGDVAKLQGITNSNRHNERKNRPWRIAGTLANGLKYKNGHKHTNSEQKSIWQEVASNVRSRRRNVPPHVKRMPEKASNREKNDEEKKLQDREENFFHRDSGPLVEHHLLTTGCYMERAVPVSREMRWNESLNIGH